MTPVYIHGVHDADGAGLMEGKPGWVVITEAIGCDPTDMSGKDYMNLASRGFDVIVRLNNGYGGEEGDEANWPGTIPTPDKYEAFAQRCANFVLASPGCQYVVIGNEPNHRNEWPKGRVIMPADYAACFRMCRQRIDQVAQVEVLVAGPAPWDIESGMDWVTYFGIVLTQCGPCDGVAIHAYTHGSDPALIRSEEMQHGWHWHFRVYRDQCELLSDLQLDYLPVYITETDQVGPWADVNSGWVKAAYAEIDEWNVFDALPLVRCLCLYRSNVDDQWSFADKLGVQNDFRDAVSMGYMVTDSQLPRPPEPLPPQPHPPEDIPDRSIDQRLAERGVVFTYVTVPAGQWYWRLVEAQWLDVAEADAVGPDHHILGEVLKNGGEVAGVNLRVSWPSGSTNVVSKADDLHASYNYDYPMSASLNEYSIVVDEGVPSDAVAGIGMGKDGNAGEHTSTWLTWQYMQSSGEEPLPPTGEVETGYVIAPVGLNVRSGPDTSYPVLGVLEYGSTVLYDGSERGWHHVVDGWVSADYVGPAAPLSPLSPPAPSPGGLIHPLPGSVITQHFYQDPAAYEQWGLVGHDGTDLAGPPAGTSVRCIADGEVYVVDFDEDYGNYVMVAHPDRLCYSMYCHAAQVLVAVGQRVQAGETLMLLGSTGNSTGAHLHLEIRLLNPDGTYREDTPQLHGRVDPETYCAMHGLKL